MVSAIHEIEEIGRKERNFDNIPNRMSLGIYILVQLRDLVMSQMTVEGSGRTKNRKCVAL